MAYTLGNITLPRPKSFTREFVEQSSTIRTLNNTTKKDITGRKERYVLTFTKLTQAQMTSILNEFDLFTTRNFTVNETNLTIAATPVHIFLERRDYNTPGNEYREDIVLILEEVS